METECGTTVQYDGGLFLRLREGRFVGWTVGSPGLTTGDGIGVGATLADLRASFGTLQVTEGTLGPEFSTGQDGLAGFLAGTDDASVVTSLGAGDQCLAR